MIFQSARSGSWGIGSSFFAKWMSRITLDFAAGGCSPCAIAFARARMLRDLVGAEHLRHHDVAFLAVLRALLVAELHFRNS